MNKKVLKLLEYNKIIDLLTDQAGSSAAKERIKSLAPMVNQRMVKDALTETTEAVSVILYKGSIPVGEIGSIENLLMMSRKGRTLSMKELLTIRRCLVTAGEVKTFLSSDLPELKVIPEMAALITALPDLEQEIDRCILSEDEMSDTASSKLKSIRRDIRNKNESIRNRLSRLTNSQSTQKYLQDPIVTLRNGRYVIPVKKEYSTLVPGLIHDQSQTGSTLFIEPQAVVEMNNELRELELAEQAEIARILKEFTDRVAEHYHEIHNNQELLTELDVINAKGKLSRLMEAEEPHVNTDGVLDIKKGRHPLIPSDKVVPIDVSLGREFRTLLITGPNTGGKTVTLKTIGLFVLMTESGLHIPCYSTSDIPLFKEVYADIGDEQSIEQSLSTFSSHMSNISTIMQSADRDSLVLLDELGAGTDPAEGAALGIALMEKLSELGSYVAATTHYTELKKYALSTNDVENASMEFDIETLSPTYRLRMGLPGKSNAFEISRKLGLSDGIIHRAADLLDKNELDFESAVTSVEQDKIAAEKARDEAEKMAAEAEEKLRKADEKLETTRQARQRILEEARDEARGIVRDAEGAVDEVSRELRRAQKASQKSGNAAAIADSRRILREAGSRNRVRPDVQERPKDAGIKPEDISVGMGVKVLTIGQNGEIETLPDERGNVNVRVGSIKMNVNAADLIIIENEREGNKERKRRSYSKLVTGKAKTVSTSLNVIGRNLDDASVEMQKYIDDAYLAGIKKVAIIHGRGEGILKEGLRAALKSNKCVKSFKGASYNEGGEGVTVVELKDK